MIKVKRALISVFDKTGLVEFARGLHELGVEILSTGGTARLLKGADIPVVEVSEYTRFPEILSGRVKTLHPAIHGALLALREKPDHMEQLKRHNIDLIDMVVVNLYPFDRVVQKDHVTVEEALEYIDIGGPSMLRSAAKNFKSVAVVCNPLRYNDILDELKNNSGLLSDSVLRGLAIEVFQRTAQYDHIIFDFLNTQLKSSEFSGMPKDYVLHLQKVQDLRYGENPHQQGAFYGYTDAFCGLARLKQIHGKELSFNNILDLHSALDVVKDFDSPCAVVIKHNNPTGIAQDDDLAKAYTLAWRCDLLSAFGGVIGLNKKVDLATAEQIAKSGFMECVIAPQYESRAIKILTKKNNFRIVQIDFKELQRSGYDFKQVNGGLLLQEKDTQEIQKDQLQVVTKTKPSSPQWDSILFGWKAVKHVRSNAIVLVKGTKTVGIGCGQTSRVESAQLAIKKAGKQAKNAIFISDAFLPKTDNVRVAAKAGIKVIVQTGGSIADKEVIKAADTAKIAMVMTGIRHFKH